MSLLSRRVNGNTILEVVVALIIISVSVGLTGTLFSSVFNASARMIKQQAWYDVSEQVNRVKHEGGAMPLEIDKTHYLLSIEVETIDKEKGLVYIVINCLDGKGIELAGRRFFFEMEETE